MMWLITWTELLMVQLPAFMFSLYFCFPDVICFVLFLFSSIVKSNEFKVPRL